MCVAAARLLACCIAVIPTAFADEFPQTHDTENDTAQPMQPAEATAAITVPDGFHVELFAAEPSVRNPIAMAWDEKGRMWVAENFTYAERPQRFDLSLRDRVLVFDDEDGDGRADTRKVFIDNVQMLTSVEVGRGGVWLMCPPQLLFIPDADADCVPDGPAQIVLDGFTVAQDNYHNFANGLRWGPDGWLYGRCGHSCPGNIGVPGTPAEQRVPIWGGIWRFHPERKIVEVICHGTVNPWGHDWDRNGELFFINTVIGHVWHAMPGSHFRESHGETRNPLVYERMDMIGDHYHFETRESRSQRDRKTTDQLGGGHAHIGMAICLSEHWPDFCRDRLFTLNMHGHRINSDHIVRDNAGFTAHHQPDFLRSTDPFFRGLEVSFGPDGNMFVLDWSDTGECHEFSGVHRSSGRIFKISYGDQGKRTSIAKPNCAGLPGPLADLWSRYRQGDVTRSELKTLLRHDSESVRVWAVRLLTDFWPLDTVHGPHRGARYPDDPEIRQELSRLAREDPSGMMLLTLASTLQRLPVNQRIPLASALLSRGEFAADRDLPFLVWYGLMPVAEELPQQLAELAAVCEYPLTLKWITRHAAARITDHPQELETILTASTSMTPELRKQVLSGTTEALRGWRQAEMPSGWQAFSDLVAASDRDNDIRKLNAVFGDGVALAEIRQIALNDRAALDERISALNSLIESRPDDLAGICRSLLRTRTLNLTAARGLMLSDDAEIGQLLIDNYRRFHSRDRPALLDLLVSRPGFALALLNSVGTESGQIPLRDIGASHARQIQSLHDPLCDKRLAEVWGKLRTSPAGRLQEIKRWRDHMATVTVTQTQLQHGRQLFRKTCAQCHRLYGEGKSVGPDLTGSQRSNPDYLLQNIIDPGAVVSPQHRMSIVVLNNGRVLNGLIVESNERTIILQTATASEVLNRDDIETIRETTESAMPDGLLKPLPRNDVTALLAYLMHPIQVPLSDHP